MNSDHYDLIRDIAEALYRSTGAIPTFFTSDDVKAQAEQDEFSEAECRDILDMLVDAGDFFPLIEMAIETFRDARADAAGSVPSLFGDIRLKLAELEGSISIAEGAGS